MYPNGQEAGLFSGVVFGLFLAGCLALSKILDNLWRAVRLIAVATAAYFFSTLTAFAVQLCFPEIVPRGEQWSMGTREPASAVALFVGGLVGGFLVFGEVIFLFCPEISKGLLARKAFQWALLGGILGVAGWALRSSVGAATWNLFHVLGLTPSGEASAREWFGDRYDYGETSRMYSLYVVWQTGVAIAVGIMLRGYGLDSRTKELRQT